MFSHERLSPAVLLAAIGGPFVFGAWPPSVFLGWGLVAAGLALSWRARAAKAALVTLAALVGLTLFGFGVTFGRSGFRLTLESLQMLGAMAALGTLWVPPGVLLAFGPARDTPSRLARVGVGLMVLWAALFSVILIYEARTGALLGDAHIVPFALGALAVTAALAWRVARPPRVDKARPLEAHA
jgi:hypothetical protein